MLFHRRLKDLASNESVHNHNTDALMKFFQGDFFEIGALSDYEFNVFNYQLKELVSLMSHAVSRVFVSN